jgi:hypothetical protein
MTPKEKAEELFQLYLPYVESGHIEEIKYRCKQCALIAVEFAREQFYKHCSAEMDTRGTYDDHFDVLKQEIEKLYN